MRAVLMSQALNPETFNHELAILFKRPPSFIKQQRFKNVFIKCIYFFQLKNNLIILKRTIRDIADGAATLPQASFILMAWWLVLGSYNRLA